MAKRKTAALQSSSELVTRCLQYCKLEGLADNPEELALFQDLSLIHI